MTSYISLSYADLLLASVFLALNAGFSLLLQLRLERQLIVSGLRLVIQLLLVGLALKTIFTLVSPWLTLLVAAVMAAFAGREVWARQNRRFVGLWGAGLGGGAMLFAGTIVTIFALTLQIKPTPWWSPQYTLPLFGMILGNTMTGVSLGLDTLHTAVHRESIAIEAKLLLGYSKWDAMAMPLRQAVRSGFMPIINSMAATGVVSLPGMMTGQILSGVDPQEAVKYQILITLLIGGATGLGVLAATLASAWRLMDDRDRLRLDRLSAVSG